MRTYTGLIFNKITQPNADALTLAEDTVIDHCIFDFRSIPLPEQDEIVSSVNGPKVIIRNSLFLGGIKALLAGNGDHLINDSTTASWDLKTALLSTLAAGVLKRKTVLSSPCVNVGYIIGGVFLRMLLLVRQQWI